MHRINVTFRCKHCKGSGLQAPGQACEVCKGRGCVVHQFEDVIKVTEFPLPDIDYAEFREVPCGGPSYSG